MKINTQKFTDRSENTYEAHEATTNLGLTVTLPPSGASVQKIATYTAQGGYLSMALSLPDPTVCPTDTGHAGATPGPNIGRICGSELPIGKQICHLTLNEGHHQLHGGPHNLFTIIWATGSAICTHGYVKIQFSSFQPDRMDGSPGNRTYRVAYTLNDTNWLTVEYSARTDSPAYTNLSNHIYRNLSGDLSRSGLEQELIMFSNNTSLLGMEFLPVDIIPAAGTAFDFRRPRRLDNAMRSLKDECSRSQLYIGKGYNHALLLNKPEPFHFIRSIRRTLPLKKACVLRDPGSGQVSKAMTDAPVLVLYTGGFLQDGLFMPNNQYFRPSYAIALEAQGLPDVMYILPHVYRLTTPTGPLHRIVRFHLTQHGNIKLSIDPDPDYAPSRY